MLAPFSIPGKRGRSGSRAPTELAPPFAAKHGRWGNASGEVPSGISVCGAMGKLLFHS